MKKRTIQLTDEALADLRYWLSHDTKIAKRIMDLIEDCQRNPFQGIGKPEPLKHQLQGNWSRRITDTDRMIYRVEDEVLVIDQLRYHY